METKKIPVFQLVTKFKTAETVKGCQINLSIADARSLYTLTTINPEQTKLEEDNENNLKREKCRIILRNIAKRVLFQEGETTNIDELIQSFIYKPKNNS